MTAMEAKKKKRKPAKMGARIIRAMKRLNLNPNAVASMMGVHHPSVYNWCSGKAEPNGINLHKLAMTLQVSTEYLLGLEELTPVTPVEIRDNVVLLPLFPDTVKIMKPIPDSKTVPLAMMPATTSGGPNRFFLQMGDTSMTSQDGGISVPKGAFVLIDPDADYASGDYVAAKLVAGTRTLIRKYVAKGKNKWLEALNPAIESVKINDATIIVGVVTVIQIPLK